MLNSMLKKTLTAAAIALVAGTSLMAPSAEARSRGYGGGHKFHGGHKHFGSHKYFGHKFHGYRWGHGHYGYYGYGHCKVWSSYGKYCIKW